MKRALVVTLPERGHYHPLLAPARALMARGIELAFACGADIRDELAAVGISRCFVPPSAGPPAPALRGAELSRIIADAATLRGWIEALLVERPLRAVAHLRAVVRDFRPDAIAIDTMAYEGAIAAELEGVPWVGWSTSLNPVVPASWDSDLLQTTRALEPQRRALFTAHGLAARFRVSDVLSPRGTAVFTTPDVVGEAPEPSVHLVGPSLHAPQPPRRSRQGRPRVYASFGSQAWYQPARFDRLLALSARIGCELHLSAGELAEEYARRGLPAGVTVDRYADQLSALAGADVFVTHGGANSVMEGLALGVPMLVAPLCNDQPHNLRFVERAGAGRCFELDRASPEALATQVEILLAEAAPERLAAARIARAYRDASGAEGAARLLERSCA